jgi:hypothetical protein
MVIKSQKQIIAIVNNCLWVPYTGVLMLTSYNTTNTKLNQFVPWIGSFDCHKIQIQKIVNI